MEGRRIDELEATSEPPSWFINYMDKMKQNLVAEITAKVVYTLGFVLDEKLNKLQKQVSQPEPLSEELRDTCISPLMLEQIKSQIETCIQENSREKSIEENKMKEEKKKENKTPDSSLKKDQDKRRGVKSRDERSSLTGNETEKLKMQTRKMSELDLNFRKVCQEREREKSMKKARKKFSEKIKEYEKVAKKADKELAKKHKKWKKVDMYDNEVEVYDCVVVRDESVPDGTSVPPGGKFLKKWRVLNSGNTSWNSHVVLRNGYNYGLKPNKYQIECDVVYPQKEVIFAVEFQAPVTEGYYESHWAMYHKHMKFGSPMWVSVVVEEPPVLPMRFISDFKKFSIETPDEEIRIEENGGGISPVFTRPKADAIVSEKSPLDEEIQKQNSEAEISITKEHHDDVPSVSSEEEFVVIPMPACFDMKVPFDDEEMKKSVVYVTKKVGKQTEATQEDEFGSCQTSDTESACYCDSLSTSSKILNMLVSDEDPVARRESTHTQTDDFTASAECNSSTPIPLGDNFHFASPIETDLPRKLTDTAIDAVSFTATSSCYEPTETITDTQRSQNSTTNKEESECKPTSYINSFQPTSHPQAIPTTATPILENSPRNTPSPSQNAFSPFRNTSSPSVHILPEGLVNGTLQAAATVYNGAKGMFEALQTVSQGRVYPDLEAEGETTDPLEMLFNMGFYDVELNQALLLKHEGDINKVIQELVLSSS